MSNRQKFIPLNDTLYDYIVGHGANAQDPLLQELRLETDKMGDDARMQISPEQGAFLQLITTAINANHALEIGTFTGYSSLCIARGLPASGRLTCLDVSEEWTGIARRFWREAGVDSRINLVIGPALETLSRIRFDSPLDLVFIDALKTEYDGYYELVLPQMRPNGLIIFDNMLWGGAVVEAHPDESTRALNELNRKLTDDDRVENVLLPVADGLQICRVK